MELEEKPSFLKELQNILDTYEFADINKEKDEIVEEILSKYYKALKVKTNAETNSLKQAPTYLKEAVNINETVKKEPLKKVPTFDEIIDDEEKNEFNSNNELNMEDLPLTNQNGRVLKIKKEFYCELVNLKKLYEEVYSKTRKSNDRIIIKELIESTEGLIEDVEEFNKHNKDLNKIECRLNITLPRNICASYKRIFEYLSYLINKLAKLKLINRDRNNREFLNDIGLTLTVHQNKVNNLILNCIF